MAFLLCAVIGTVSACHLVMPNVPVQRRAAQRTVRCNRLLAGGLTVGWRRVDRDPLPIGISGCCFTSVPNSPTILKIGPTTHTCPLLASPLAGRCRGCSRRHGVPDRRVEHGVLSHDAASSCATSPLAGGPRTRSGTPHADFSVLPRKKSDWSMLSKGLSVGTLAPPNRASVANMSTPCTISLLTPAAILPGQRIMKDANATLRAVKYCPRQGPAQPSQGRRIRGRYRW